MKKSVIALPFVPLLFIAALSLHGEEGKDIQNKHVEKLRHVVVNKDRDDHPMDKVPVTFLGVETAPVSKTLVAQLGLPPDIGLVVVHVMEGSPAASLLKEHDILTKFDDQLLVDARQLSVLVRTRKEGEEVTLTLYRAGKEITLKAKLGKREMPPFIGYDDMPPGHGTGPDPEFFDEELPGPGEMWTHRLPGMEPEDVHNVLRMIGRERHNWFGAPNVHFFHRDDEKGSTVLNLAEGNFVFSDDNGSVEVKAGEGKRELTVKNAKGDVTFHGSIQDVADREKLPPEVVARLRKIENVELNDEPGEDFEHETAVQPPSRTKISQPLEQNQIYRRISPSSL